MNPTNACPECGTPLAPDAPKGLCPACLLRGGRNSEPLQSSGEADENGAATAGFVPPPPEEIAQHFPQLDITELLGQGGMGAVYKARQTLLDRTVALKILPPTTGTDPSFAERFTREAKAMARLAHTNIVIVFEFGEVEGLYYLIMEYVDGVNLREAILAGQVTPAEALAVVPQICDALQYAHEEGIVHRDIKPENVLLDKKGRVKIADFGLAKLLGRSPIEITLTASQQVMGTLHYMAPEQLEKPLSVDHRADIYSLGVVFYELLTGELPLGRFKLPSEKARLDARLDEVVLKTLEREPEQRYQQASDVKVDVETISRDHRPAPPREQPAAPERTGPRPLSLPFSIPNVYAGFAEAFGIARFDGHHVSLEFEVKDGIAGVIKSELKDVTVPKEDIVSIVFQSGVFKHRIVIQTDYLRSVTEIPGVSRGKVFLNIDRADRETAERFVAAVDRSLSRESWNVATQAVVDSEPEPQPSVPSIERMADEARRQLKGPALGLAVAGVLSFLWLIGLVFFAIALFFEQDPDTVAAMFACLLAAIGAGLVVPAINSVSLRSYGWPVVAVIVGLLPVSPAVLVSAPFAIWMLVVMVQPNLRTAFKHIVHGRATPRDTLMLEMAALWERVRRAFSSKPDVDGGGLDQFEPARRRVRGPAIAMIVLGFVNLASLVVVHIALVIALFDYLDRGRFSYCLEEYVIEGTWFLWPSIPLGFVMLFCGLSMKRLGSYWLAWFGVLAALTPCSPAWLLSAPFGIWALVALAGPGVKAAFGRGYVDPQPIRGMPPKPGTEASLDPAVAQRLVRWPAIGLLVIALLDFLPAVIPFVCGMFEAFEHFPRIDWDDRQAGEFFIISLVAFLAHLPTIGLLMLASQKMRRLRWRGLALAAAVVAIIPCHAGFVLGIPFGIWSLIVLTRRDVAASFSAKHAYEASPSTLAGEHHV